MVEYKYETKRLFSNLDIFEAVETYCDDNDEKIHCWIAGGSIRNVFTNSMNDLNDYDIYFKSKHDLELFLFGIQSTEHIIIAKTDKAITIKSGDAVVQLVFFRYFENVQEIFDTFDFICVMGAYNIHEDKFELHPDFLKDNSARILRFNPGTAFPLMSALRVFKYEKKGYTISKPEYVRILLKCMTLKINSLDELKVQIGGMYGEAFENMILPENIEFSYDAVIDSLKDLYLNDDAFCRNDDSNVEINEYMDFVHEVLDLEIPYFSFAGKTFGILGKDYRVVNAFSTDKKYKEVEAPEFLKYIYKWVKRTSDGRYVSYHDNSFEYKIDEVAKPKNTYGSLYFSFAGGIENATYSNSKDGVILECEYLSKNIKNGFTSFKSSSLELTEAKPVRIVTLEEVKNIAKCTGNVFSSDCDLF